MGYRIRVNLDEHRTNVSNRNLSEEFLGILKRSYRAALIRGFNFSFPVITCTEAGSSWPIVVRCKVIETVDVRRYPLSITPED